MAAMNAGGAITVGATATTPTAADAIDISAAASSGTFGSVTAAVPVTAGDVVTATFGGLGSVTARFTEHNRTR